MPKFLFKANDDVISHCSCIGEPALSTGQLDCPWCGCGWLICCSRCTKAFTYAVVRETDISLVELGRRDATARGFTSITDQECAELATGMERALEPFRIGDLVVYLDGEYLALDAKRVRFDGYFAAHDLDVLPHAEALGDPEVLLRTLGDGAYWLDRELPRSRVHDQIRRHAGRGQLSPVTRRLRAPGARSRPRTCRPRRAG
ncbi:MAG: hypothetical protein E6J91_18910 [Deltaproteobacteria bacterium]|nr:MAG: hypothetical protein E6J91_18910 [Deltaproteobacteria bacterium]